MNTHFSLHKVAFRTFSRRGWRTIFCFIALALLALPEPLRAVETSGTYNTSEASLASSVSGWSSGWGASNDASGITGWNYVGQVNGASGVYLGNGWVLTAAHVGAGTFVLDGTSYNVVAGSAQAVASGVDLTLFQIATSPALPSLTLNTTALTLAGSQVAMIGYGGGAESWGYNTVSSVNQSTSVTVGATTYTSTDFVTNYGANGSGPHAYTNNSTFVAGDSGGGDFVYVSGTGWELAGINEAVDTTSSNAFMVQISSYSTKINQVTAVPEPSSLAMLAVSGMLLGGIAWLRRRREARFR